MQTGVDRFVSAVTDPGTGWTSARSSGCNTY